MTSSLTWSWWYSSIVTQHERKEAEKRRKLERPRPANDGQRRYNDLSFRKQGGVDIPQKHSPNLYESQPTFFEREIFFPSFLCITFAKCYREFHKSLGGFTDSRTKYTPKKQIREQNERKRKANSTNEKMNERK